MEAITRKEKIMSGENLTPITRKEMFLAKAAGMDVEPPEPITREEFFLSKIGGSSGGTGGGGTGGEEWIGDGKTHLWIEIAAEGRMTIPLTIALGTSNNSIEVDWGDGSEPQTFSGSQYCYPNHTYQSVGEYIITFNVPEGKTFGFSNQSSNNLFGILNSGIDAPWSYRLKKVEIGNDMPYVASYSFTGCQCLASIFIPESVTGIGDYAFESCVSLTNITIPKNVTTLGMGVFRYMYTIKSITLPKGITSIANNLFFACSSLTNITIPEGVTSIGQTAFQNCYSLTELIIPPSVTSIAYGAFSRCYALKLVDFTKHTSVPALTGTLAFDRIASDCEIRVPAALYDEWIAATNWSTYASKIVAV